MTQQLTIALTKGRILKQTLPLLQAAGLAPVEDIASRRKLIFNTEHANVRLVILCGSDVPTYVRHGAADIGVVGKDMLVISIVIAFSKAALVAIPRAVRSFSPFS